MRDGRGRRLCAGPVPRADRSKSMRKIRLSVFLLLLACGTAAHAEKQIAFYSKDMASSFPHAYVRLTGSDDATGQPIDVNYGFTPVRLSPAILFGPVNGMIQSVGPEYIARSDRHFEVALTPDQYARVVAVVEKWRDSPQPNYRLNGRNCVDFVADVANAIGISAPVIPKLMKKPKSYLQTVTRMNSQLLASWPARLSVVSSQSPDPAPRAN